MQNLNYLELARQAGSSIQLGNLCYDPVKRQLWRDHQEIELEPKSRELLEVLLQQVGEPVSTEVLIRTLWGNEYLSRNVLTNRIGALRSTLNIHLQDVDANKLIVTYPRQGYLIDNALVSLTEPANTASDEKGPSAASLIPPETAHKRFFRSRKSTAWAGLISVVLIGLILLAGFHERQIYGVDSSLSVSPAQREVLPPDLPDTKPTSVMEVSTVNLLLGRIRIQQASQEPLQRVLKATLLRRLMASPQIDVKNLDAPDFFLASMDTGERWPGFPMLGSIDYQLNAYLQQAHEAPSTETILTLELVVPSTGKSALNTRYSLTGMPERKQLDAIASDITRFLTLPNGPYPPEPANYHWITLPTTQLMTELSAMPMTELQASWLARRILREWPASHPQIAPAITLLERQQGRPTGELGIWLGLLHGLQGDYGEAAALLDRSRRQHSVDNAFVYFNRAYYAQQLADDEGLQYNYIRQLGSLQYGLPARTLFQRLAQPENAESCRQPWSALLPANLSDSSAWLTRLHNFCHGVAEALITMPSENARSPH